MQYAQLTLSTHALQHNLDQIRARAPDLRILAMVKANGYGHGVLEVAQVLARHRRPVEGLGVARFNEAWGLDQGGIRLKIVLLEGITTAEELITASQKRWAIVIHHQSQLEMLTATACPLPLEVWVKMETGMHRLGFMPSQFPAVCDAIRGLIRNQKINPDPVLLSHLACADEPGSEQVRIQIQRFKTYQRAWMGPTSLANSAGIFAWPELQQDWVRPGIGLYGVSPFASGVGADLGLKPVMTLTASVIATKIVPAGETVGYGARWVAPADTPIAIISIGYGDGYPRSRCLDNTYPLLVMIQGVYCPVIGHVSMDMIMVDCSAATFVEVGMRVLLWGEDLPVEQVARAAGTVGYTLLTQMTQRVTRIWI
jgi:alanine racemase